MVPGGGEALEGLRSVDTAGSLVWKANKNRLALSLHHSPPQ